MKHGIISLAGWAALACWLVFMLVALPGYRTGQPPEPSVAAGAVGLAAVVLTILWARGRIWWLRNEMRAEAYREGWLKAKRRERQEAERGREKEGNR